MHVSAKSAVLVCLLGLILLPPGTADEKKSRKDVPLAPLPDEVRSAKKVFIANGGGSDLAYDTFYSEMSSWGRFELVGSPEEADLIFEVAYGVVNRGTRVWSSTNTYTGATQVHSAQVTDPQVVLTIYDGKTRNPLWSTVEHRRLARRQKNREKELIKATQRLIENLRRRMEVQE